MEFKSTPGGPIPQRKNGLLLVDKPQTWTSHDVVAFVRKRMKMKEVGHCGTLDPLASGLMVLLLGEGTKMSSYILEEDKTYLVTALLGVQTDTLDLDGQVTAQAEVTCTEVQIQQIIQELTGALQLKVPAFSAIKVDGVRLYKKARAAEVFEPPVREMVFRSVQLVKIEGPEVQIKIHCSKGSYIRSWVKEFGDRLGCGATVKELRRLRSEPYSVEQALALSELEGDDLDIARAFIELPLILPHWMTVRVDGMDQRLLSNGAISHHLKSRLMSHFKIGSDHGVKVIDEEGRLLALIEFQLGSGFAIRRVFRH